MNNFSFNCINHVTILVKDKKKAIDFYTNVLAFEPMLVANKHLWFKVGNNYIHCSQLSESDRSINDTFYHFAISVYGFKAYLDYLVNKGVYIFEMEKNQSMKPLQKETVEGHFFLKDPDGNLIEFVDSDSQFFNPKG